MWLQHQQSCPLCRYESILIYVLFYGHLRAEITADTRISEAAPTPVAPVDQIHAAASNVSHACPQNREVTEKGIVGVKLEDHLQDSFNNHIQVPASYPVFYISVADCDVCVVSDLSGNRKILRFIAPVSS
jgi:hypothetical protein